MTITVAQTKAILDTLPIGYYLGMKAPVVLDEESPTSYVDMMAREIHVSFANVREGAAGVAESEGAEWIIRSLLYHEVGHLLLTPIELFEVCYRSLPPPAMNLMEDARVEALLAHRFHGVDFPRLVAACIKVDWTREPAGIMDFMFRLLRFRRGPAGLLAKWDNIVINSPTMSHYALICSYCDFYEEIVSEFAAATPKKNAASVASAAASAAASASAAREAAEKAQRTERDCDGHQAAQEAGSNAFEITDAVDKVGIALNSLHGSLEKAAKAANDAEVKEKTDSLRKKLEGAGKANATNFARVTTVRNQARKAQKKYEIGDIKESSDDCKAAADASQAVAKSLEEIAETAKEVADAISEIIEMQGECGGGGRMPHEHPFLRGDELSDADFRRACEGLAEQVTEFTSPDVDAVVKRIILRVARKAGTQTGNSYGYSGRINPRAVGTRDDYRWLVKPGDSGAKNHSRLHLRLWCDVSGSFRHDIDVVNKLISSLMQVEKSMPELFKLTILLMGDDNRLGDKHKRLEANENNDFGPDVAQLARETSVPGWKTIDVMVWDGQLADGDVVKRHPDAFKALDKPSTIIVSDGCPYNQETLDKGCPSAKRTYIRDDYAGRFTKTVLAALDCAL